MREKMFVRRILEIPFLYQLSQKVFGKPRGRNEMMKYLKHERNARILDIGCGTADIVNSCFLDANYIGFDMQRSYIENDRKKYKGHKNIRFYCENVNDSSILNNLSKQKYDLIIMLGVLHHLDDEECEKCLKSVSVLLKKGGRFVSIDGLRWKGQSLIERKLMDYDRGQYVRYEEEYLKLIRKYIPDAKYDIRHDLYKFPYTHIIFY